MLLSVYKFDIGFVWGGGNWTVYFYGFCIAKGVFPF